MLLDANDFSTLDDSQRLAVLETMVIGLLADNKVEAAEVRRFDEIVLDLPWGVPRPVLVSMITGARNRLVALKTPDQFRDYLIQLAEKVPAPELRDKIVFTMATIMYADGVVDQAEKNILGMFVMTWNITSDRVAAIKARLNRTPAPEPTPAPETN
ncbi:MAG TPA: TerB family tellurite resistance protein [Kofleriaceae bacterium]|jgi:uncharacterized tellurite resistance protein B-like protein